MMELAMDDVIGSDGAKEAARRAVATGRSLLLLGPPGCGKTMLVRRIGSLMPPMTERERAECWAIRMVAGLDPELPTGTPRPFRAPHHTCGRGALAGSGGRVGEVHLAHNGILFLDEAAEFHDSVMEDVLSIRRRGGPPLITLVGASALCPCGYRGLPARTCRCSREAVAAFWAKLRRQGWDDVVRMRPEPVR